MMGATRPSDQTRPGGQAFAGAAAVNADEGWTAAARAEPLWSALPYAFGPSEFAPHFRISTPSRTGRNGYSQAANSTRRSCRIVDIAGRAVYIDRTGDAYRFSTCVSGVA